MAERRMLPVPDGLEGQRLDVGLARLLGLSRSRVAELAAEGAITLDGQEAQKSQLLNRGALLEVWLPEERTATPGEPLANLDIRYEDTDLVVVDKPVGVAAHPSPGWQGPTVVGALRATGRALARSGPGEREGVVHRLDVGTSGLMAVAKSELAYRRLKDAFRDRRVRRSYHAVVQGHMDPLRGTIDAPVGRHPSAEHRFAVVATGKPAITHYTTLEALRAASLLEVELETGRTHQIRVHTQTVGHPCLGDLTYGADPKLGQRLGLQRQWLHAVGLGLAHPASGVHLEVTSDYPPDLAAALDTLREDDA